jgi:hypothetical protein
MSEHSEVARAIQLLNDAVDELEKQREIDRAELARLRLSDLEEQRIINQQVDDKLTEHDLALAALDRADQVVGYQLEIWRAGINELCDNVKKSMTAQLDAIRDDLKANRK